MKLYSLLTIAILSAPACSASAVEIPGTRPSARSGPGHVQVPKATIRADMVFGADRLGEPIGVAITNKKLIWVTDAGSGRIEVFNRQGRHMKTVTPAEATLQRPMHLAARGDALWVPEFLSDRILQVSRGGAIRRRLSGGFDAPAGVAVAADGAMYVADFYHHQIVVLSAAGEITGRWGSGKPGNPFTYPTDLALSPDGKVIYVADAYAHRIVALDPTGKQLHSWGGKGKQAGRFDVAVGVATDAKGRVYVADFYNHRVQVFDDRGQLRAVFGHKGRGLGELDRPTDLAVIGDQIFVVDFGNHRLQAFTWSP